MTPADLTASRREQALEWLLRLQRTPDDVRLRDAFEQWCASDAANAEAYHNASRLWQLTGQLAPTTTEHWSKAPVEQLPVRRRRWWLGAAVAACWFVAVAPSVTLRLQADYRTAQDETRDVTLADGSLVHLDSDTAIAVDYSAGHRNVRLLAGQAFFEVQPDARKPFHVRADAVEVTVTGTAFNVELRPDGMGVDVQHGSVRVEQMVEGHRRSDVLTAGDRLRTDQGQVNVSAFEPSQAAVWRQRQLIANDQPVADVVQQLTRYLPGKVVLRDAALGDKRVTGVYDLRKPAEALRAVVRPHGGAVQQLGPWLWLIARP